MSTKFTCRFCKEQFDVPKGLYKHLQIAHNAGVSRDNRTCPICGVLCSKYEGYRDHLLYIHGQTDDGQKLTFKSLNEFLIWKAELELKHNCKYVLQTSPKVLPTKEKKYFYQCDRSDSKSKDKKSVSVVMKTCSSVISVVEGTGVFKVEYWDVHSGHIEAPSLKPEHNELEPALSSVEMVNVIADSDDSFDRSEELLSGNSSSPSLSSNPDKQSFFDKTNSPSSVNSFSSSSFANAKRMKTMQSSIKVDNFKKKNTNTSVLFSLASVACGKGISKKTASKISEKKSVDASLVIKTEPEDNLKNNEKSIDNSHGTTEKQKKSPSTLSTSEIVPVTKQTTVASSSVTSTTSLTLTPKSSSGFTAIAPKTSNIVTKTVNSLFTSNNAFPNQLVIVNPVGMDQNSLNSSQNVFTAGQNILVSLGSLGQNILPPNSASKSINSVSGVKDKITVSTANIKTENSAKVSASAATKASTTVKSSVTVSQSTTKNTSSTVTSTTTSSTPLTLTTGLNSAPVILSSLPVGSTFMSVNNNLIPLAASPSGAFLPANLPPNIVLTSVMSGSGLPNAGSSLKNTSVSATPPSAQTQVRYTTPSTVAITVSSIVKEPVYTTSSVRHMNNTAPSNPSPVSSLPLKNSLKNYSKNKPPNKLASSSFAGRISPLKNIAKFMSSTPVKPNQLSKLDTGLLNTVADISEINLPVSKSVTPTSKSATAVSAGSVNFTAKRKSLSSVAPFISVSSALNAGFKNKTARKRITKSTGSPVTSSLNSRAASSTPVAKSSLNTKVVNSQLQLGPISSAPNVKMTTQQLNAHKPGTYVFESSGDVYMLEPVENDGIGNTSSTKNASKFDTFKIKIDRSVQTNESCNSSPLKSKFQRKRAAPPTDDSAVMLKVKCYQLEMKYISIQTECKQLKLELTRERMKNAELTGEKLPKSVEEEAVSDSSRSKAVEIMKEIEDKFSENKDVNIYTMTKTSVLRSLYEDLEGLCIENSDLHKELENYRTHDKFYKSLKKKLYDEEF